MIDVSIIIPVYNCERYIDRCINSILDQTVKNFEIIIINDGSTDNSLKKIYKYSSNQHVKIYDQKNQGPAIARNNGIKYSSGKYVMFVDADDYVDKDYIEKYLNEIEKTGYDIVIGGYKRVVGDKIVSKQRLKNYPFAKYLITGPVCRIIKREFLIKNNIYFLDTNSSEDVYFNIIIYNITDKIGIINDTGYYYYYNSASLSNTVHKGFKKDVKIIELLEQINLNNCFDLNMNQYFVIKYCIWYLLYSGRTASKQEFMAEYIKLFTWLNNNIKDFEKNMYISLFKPKGEPLKHRMIIWVFMQFHKLNLVSFFAKIYCKGE